MQTKTNVNFKNIMTKIKTNEFFVVCKESRIENNTSFYGCFYLGPFDDSLSQTLANDLRRTLLSELTGLAITSIEIEGVLHKFSSIPGMKESVLDLISNFQNIVLKKTNTAAQETKCETSKTKKTYTGFLNVNGPRIIKAKDLKLPSGLQCVDPNQYIATLAQDGFLSIKFNINEGKNFIKQKPSNLDVNKLKKRNILMQDLKLRFLKTKTNNSNITFSNNRLKQSFCNTIPLDAVFMPVTKINCIVEENKLFTDFSTDVENTTTNFQKMDKNLFIGSKVAGCSAASQISKKKEAGFFFKKNAGFKASIEKLTTTSVFTAADQPALNIVTDIFEKPNVISTNLNTTKTEDSLREPDGFFKINSDFKKKSSAKQDFNFADFFLNYTKKPQTCFVPTKNPFKLIPWESNTLYFDLQKSDLLDVSQSTKSSQPSEHLSSSFFTTKYLFKFLKKKLKEDETTFNLPSAELKIFLALNKRHLQKKLYLTRWNNQSAIPIPKTFFFFI